MNSTWGLIESNLGMVTIVEDGDAGNDDQETSGQIEATIVGTLHYLGSLLSTHFEDLIFFLTVLFFVITEAYIHYRFCHKQELFDSLDPKLNQSSC